MSTGMPVEALIAFITRSTQSRPPPSRPKRLKCTNQVDFSTEYEEKTREGQEKEGSKLEKKLKITMRRWCSKLLVDATKPIVVSDIPARKMLPSASPLAYLKGRGGELFLSVTGFCGLRRTHCAWTSSHSIGLL